MFCIDLRGRQKRDFFIFHSLIWFSNRFCENSYEKTTRFYDQNQNFVEITTLSQRFEI